MASTSVVAKLAPIHRAVSSRVQATVYAAGHGLG